MTARDLLTVGYQGTVADTLIRGLVGAGVRRVIDVRAIPMSRKPGFSKRILAASLAASGIDYAHLPGLGTPKPGRDAARRGDRGELERIYGAHLGTATALAALATALELSGARTSCLLCFEADPGCCHRRLVADRLSAAAGFTVHHLRPPDAARPTASEARLHGHEET